MNEQILMKKKQKLTKAANGQVFLSIPAELREKQYSNDHKTIQYEENDTEYVIRVAKSKNYLNF